MGIHTYPTEPQLNNIVVNYDKGYNGLTIREFYKATKDLMGQSKRGRGYGYTLGGLTNPM